MEDDTREGYLSWTETLVVQCRHGDAWLYHDSFLVGQDRADSLRRSLRSVQRLRKAGKGARVVQAWDITRVLLEP